MSTLPYRPGLMLRATWFALLALFSAAAGAMVAWYAGLLWLSTTIGAESGAPDGRPPDLGERLDGWLWPEALVPFVLVSVAAGAASAHRATTGDPSPRRWRVRRSGLGGGAIGALVGAVWAVLLVGGWSVARLSFDPEAPPPSVSEQSADLAAFGLLLAVPLACSMTGAWWGGRTHPG